MKEFTQPMTNKEISDIEDRIICFANLCICIAERLPNCTAGKRYATELIRSSSNTALFYSDMQHPESGEEYTRKMNMMLNEIRVSRINLRIIARKPLLKSYEVTTATKAAHALERIFKESMLIFREDVHN